MFNSLFFLLGAKSYHQLQLKFSGDLISSITINNCNMAAIHTEKRGSNNKKIKNPYNAQQVYRTKLWILRSCLIKTGSGTCESCFRLMLKHFSRTISRFGGFLARCFCSLSKYTSLAALVEVAPGRQRIQICQCFPS